MTYFDGTYLVADTLEELRAFAKKCGVEAERFFYWDQPLPYYVINNLPDKLKVWENGAVEISNRDILKISKKLIKPKTDDNK